MSPEPWTAPPSDPDEEQTFVQSPPPLRLAEGDDEATLADPPRPYTRYETEESAYPDDEVTQTSLGDTRNSRDLEAETGVYVVPDSDSLEEGDGRPPLTLLQGGAGGPQSGVAGAQAGAAAVDLPVRRTYAPAEEAAERPALSLPRGGLAWLVAHVADVLTLAGVLSLVGVVHAWGMARFPAWVDDEGTYISQAWAVVKLHALAPYTYWYDHPPLGWLQMAAWSWIVPSYGPDQYAMAAARSFMLVVALASALCVYLIALRLRMPRPFAAIAVLLFTLSPLALYYQRMVLLDNLGVFWLLLALLLALTPQGRLMAYGAAGVALAVAVLTKETFLLFAPAVLLAVWQTSRVSSRRFAVAMFATLFVLVGSFYPLFSVLRGELVPGEGHTSLIGGIIYQLTRPSTGSIFDAGSQTFRVVQGWLATDPWLLGFALALLPVGLALRRLRPVALALLISMLMLLRPNGYLPAMYVSAVLPFAAIVAAGVAAWAYASVRAPELGPARRGAEGARVHRSSGLRRLRVARVVPAALAAVVAVAFVTLAVPAWVRGDRAAMTVDVASPSRKAIDWLAANAPRTSYLLVDDVVWTDLVTRGFARERTVWSSKLDLDPSVGGISWSRFNYVVHSSLVPWTAWGKHAREVWDRARPVKTFTHGRDWVQIRKVVHPAPAPKGQTPLGPAQTRGP